VISFDALLDPLPATCVRVAMTTACNLRCVYCAVSAPDWEARHIAGHLVERVPREVAEVAEPGATILVNGAGETTFMPGWQGACAALMEAGLPLGMTTNLARIYSDDDIALLARFRVLLVSIDSFDDALIRSIRRKVSVERVRGNVARIRQAAEDAGRPSPEIRLSCGLYDRNTPELTRFAEAAVELGVTGVTFWNLDAHDALPTAGLVTPLYELAAEDLAPRLREIAAALSVLEAAGVEVEIAGDFLAPLQAGLEAAEVAA
jgi:MoaA/NifB/PqqE/SkfB family radical SAM enzyme